MRSRPFLFLVTPLLLALGPFERNPETVDQGLQAFRAERYEEALEKFEAAKKEFPDRPELDLDRGNALFKLGRLEEAKVAFESASGAKDPSLKARALANLGNTHVAAGDEKKAIAAYRQALRVDPKDPEIRHNLEVLLRNLKPPENQPNDAGQDAGPDGGADGGTDAGRDGGADGGSDAGRDGGSDGGDGGSDGGADGGDAGNSDGGDGGQQSDAGRDGGDGGAGEGEGEGDRGDAGQSDGGAPFKSDGGNDGGEPDEMKPDEGESDQQNLDGGIPLQPKTDAEKLLDAFKQNEKNLPLWKYQRQKKKRPANGKDW